VVEDERDRLRALLRKRWVRFLSAIVNAISNVPWP
jgi:hypothetical protein